MSQFRILRRQVNYQELYFFKKAEVLFQMTFVFTKRFLRRGDRTIDQMVQAARSGKQNIAEGSVDAVTSFDMEVKLVNTARGSIDELRHDYRDYLLTRRLSLWDKNHPRYRNLLDFTRHHNELSDYESFFQTMTDEEMCNLALTLCHQADYLMVKYLRHLEDEFLEEGGVKEKLTAARLGQRKTQKEIIAEQAGEIQAVKAQNAQFASELSQWRQWWGENKEKINQALGHPKEPQTEEPGTN